MKRFVILLFGLLLFSPVFSQNPTATCSSDTGLAIDTQSPLSATYDMDVSANDWTLAQAQQAASYLDSKSDLITIAVNFAEQKLEINLDLTNPTTNGWGIAEWNNHLATIR